ncbi:MAG: prepilin-type N-terminal cleavage/methylation domain-containing protein [Acidobacteria bacterium]|nr:prepilin-type N-terminal cleavage/methylation domain-containing protein [Acidobacteriota bacterium]
MKTYIHKDPPLFSQLSSSESGFSLVEAIITVAIFLMVLAAIFGVMRAGNIMQNSVSDRSEVTANARTAINYMGRETVNAGLGYSRTGAIVPDDLAFDLFKIPKDSGNERDIFPGVIAGNNISTSALSVNGEKNDVVAFISRDMEFNGGEPVVILSQLGIPAVPIVNPNGDNLLTTVPGGCSSCRKYDLYTIESADGNQALAMATAVTSSSISILDNDPLGLNRKWSDPPPKRSILTQCITGSTNNCFNYNPHATAKRVFLTSFSVDAEGTLIRTTYGNNTGASAADQIQIHPLAYGVQSFQVRYLMQDGSLLDDPSSGNSDQMKMNEVVQIEINITLKSETSENGVTSTQLINVDSTFSTRNLRYDFE